MEVTGEASIVKDSEDPMVTITDRLDDCIRTNIPLTQGD
jgi:hypothetical protein